MVKKRIKTIKKHQNIHEPLNHEPNLINMTLTEITAAVRKQYKIKHLPQTKWWLFRTRRDNTPEAIIMLILRYGLCWKQNRIAYLFNITEASTHIAIEKVRGWYESYSGFRSIVDSILTTLYPNVQERSEFVGRMRENDIAEINDTYNQLNKQNK